MSDHNSQHKQTSSQALYEAQKNKSLDGSPVQGPDIILDGLRTPENIGSALRLADAAGSQRIVILGDKDFDISSSKKLSRIARKTENKLDISCINRKEFVKKITSFRPLIAIEISSHSKSLFEFQFPESCSFILGNERHGISRELMSLCDTSVHIPMYGINGSMNVSHALAICLFEWRRQITSR